MSAAVARRHFGIAGGLGFFEAAGFDAFVEGLCARFYAAKTGRPSLAPGRCFRLLLIGYFEGPDSERAIAWRAADSLSVRTFRRLALPASPPDHFDDLADAASVFGRVNDLRDEPGV